MSADHPRTSTRLDEIRRQIRGRLHGVLREVPPDEAAELIERMALVAYRYEQRAAEHPPLHLVRDDEDA